MVIEYDVVFSPAITGVLAHLSARKDRWDVIYDLECAPGPHGLSFVEHWRADNSDISARFIYKNKIGLRAYVLSPKAAQRLYDAEGLYAMADAYVWASPWLKPIRLNRHPPFR